MSATFTAHFSEMSIEYIYLAAYFSEMSIFLRNEYIEYIYTVTVCYIYITFLRNEYRVHVVWCGVATISRLLKITGLFCKKAL